MKVQIASDLHLELLRRDPRLRSWQVVEPAPNSTLLILAGDIHQGAAAVEAFVDWPVPVLIVPGNHEAYESTIETSLAAMQAAAKGTQVRVLQREVAIIEGVRFVAATLWSDPAVMGEREAAARVALMQTMVDYRLIATDRPGAEPLERLTIDETTHHHRRDRAWLEAELNQVFAGPTVVITHHLPSQRSIAPRYAGSLSNAGFVSELDSLMGAERVQLWIHGHTHSSFDYTVAGTRVVCNPRGYARGLGSDPEHPRPTLSFENPDFQPALVIEIKSERASDGDGYSSADRHQVQG
jgi:Icc-related predicted phosphoesterase